MKTILSLAAALIAAVLPVPAAAVLNVFACEPEWGALAQELGGDQVSVYSATTAQQDPHRIEARPSLIARARNADLMICSGSDLEAGWVPLLQVQSGNGRIRPGSPGYLEASRFVARLEVPKVIDRALGDIHPGGNPHVHLDPRNIAKVGQALTERLLAIDPAGAGEYRRRGEAFQQRWEGSLQSWARLAAPLKGVPVVVYHKDFSYFINWAGMREAGSLEPRPGLPPTPAHLADLVEQMKRSPAKAIVYSPNSDPRAAQFLSERTGIPAVMIPFTVGGTEGAKDLSGLFAETIARLLAVLK
jgi:zinc/manganese transport system substrate-binding protein